jgi:AAA domain/CHC2 zinc finger
VSVQPSALSRYSPEQVEAYYANRMEAFNLRRSGGGNQYTARCPFHDDNGPSLSLNLATGQFFCHAGSCGTNGTDIHFFEMELLRRESLGLVPEHSVVTDRIVGVLGLAATPIKPMPRRTSGAIPRHKAQAAYTYTDEYGAELWTTYRFVDASGKKSTPKDRPCSCSRNPEAECEPGCVNGRIAGMGDRRVLYNWPKLVASSIAFVTEGEKNADDLWRALSSHVEKSKVIHLGDLRSASFAVTTNPDGAGGWRQDFAKEFQSKTVVKLGDNDEAGRKHDEIICGSVFPFASRVYRLALPDMEEHGDISDYLAKNSVESLIRLFGTPALTRWQPKAQSGTPARRLLEFPSCLAPSAPSERVFWVKDLIEPHSRGMVIAPAKAGKTLAILDLAIALSTGGGWMHFPPCAEKVKTAIISREDGAAMVKGRLRQLATGRGLRLEDLDGGLLVNTEEQSAGFQIDNPKDVEELGDRLRRNEVKMTFIDVLRNIHSADEHKGMRPVMAAFDRLRQSSGSQICVLHHTPKNGPPSSRGDGSIESWWDWRIAIEPETNDESIKHVSFKTKAGSPPASITVKYYESADKLSSTIRPVRAGGAR